jgi:tetratricopeptide (TPR) repeat protein
MNILTAETLVALISTKKSFKSLLLAGVIGTFGVSFTSVHLDAHIVHAQDAAQEGRQFSAKSGEIVNAALQFINTDQYQAALGEISKALALPDLNSYEKSVIYQMQGSALYEVKRTAEAIQAFENSIRAGGLLPNEASQLRLNIGQLLIGEGQYVRGAEMIENWGRSGNTIKPQHVSLLVQAWVSSENYSRALPWAQRWFKEASPKERKHFDLLNFLYNNLGQPGKQADIVKQMINRWPEDKSLWDAWSSLLANGGREQEAFEVNKMLYLGGALSDEADLLKVVQYYSFYDMPYQAAQILENEMNAGKIAQNAERLVQLSDLYRQAREYKKAIPILERAASQSGTGKLYADLGEALYNEGNCVEAEKAFQEAMTRGFDRGKSWMLIATCRYEDAQKEPREVCKTTTKAQRAESTKNKKRNFAKEAFQSVPSSSREKRNANKWVSFINAEYKAIEDRCEFEKNVEKELCFVKIKQAYDAEVFKGSFELDDQKCKAFKPEYDSIFRVKVSEAE